MYNSMGLIHSLTEVIKVVEKCVVKSNSVDYMGKVLDLKLIWNCLTNKIFFTPKLSAPTRKKTCDFLIVLFWV